MLLKLQNGNKVVVQLNQKDIWIAGIVMWKIRVRTYLVKTIRYLRNIICLIVPERKTKRK